MLGRLAINANTGLLTYHGDEVGDDFYVITIKVINPESGFATTTFNLAVNDNG
ncbi:hypothetical protein [Abyssogena phaseoliformis symbiont]|uniref:hypothetical protein n=1 Tax=Abyssogena phaseoliformis symbiont TaxID=596095 RepID=UPI001CECA88E|nr:hypothetical protein [Abyssogena phaseoliformis symbiont]MBW5289735.1 hypothetical protein [Candidatus Ruthia sp. Apha_13_S6]